MAYTTKNRRAPLIWRLSVPAVRYLTVVFLFLTVGADAQTSDSLNVDTRTAFTKSTSLISYLPPAICVGYGFLSLSNNKLKRIDRSIYIDMREDHPHFSSSIDNYMQYSPVAATYALKIAGIHGKNSLTDQTMAYLISTAIMSSSVSFFKRKMHQLRPNGDSYTAFPSGHTATAFAAAEMMNQEFGDRSIWYGIAAYSAATATGILRVYNNAHWFSNVIAGAGFGILSTKAAYVIYPHIRSILQQHRNISVAPFYYNRATGVTISSNF